VDFTLTEEQRELSGLARRILTEVEAPQRQWTEFAAAGLLDALELGFLDQCAVLIELGRAATGIPYLASIVMGASTLARFGATDQQAQWAAQATDGSLILAAALTPESPLQVEKTAEGWVVNGSFTTVLAGARADLILVPTEDGLFVVAVSDEGVTVESQEMTDGTVEARLELSNVVLSGDRVLDGAEIAPWLHERAIVGLCALQLGVVERALEMTASYATTRVQFGKAIGTFQAVAQRLADAYIDVEAIRLTMWQAAWRLAEGLPCETEVNTAKFWASDGGHRVAHTAVHVHGGVGIDLDYPLHRYFVAAKHHEFALGHATHHLLAIGRSLHRP
jgi:alkylation response protein AidB-like acyl-CoA dehydrogenase